jgi:tRNA threonylcarbamoyladenosine biosynthesis protein TsaB
VGPGHSSSLLPAVDQAMRAAGVARGDLSAIVIGGGPGSFTGLRIAAAMAKGIGQALGVPLLAYSGLAAAAASAWAAPGEVCALFDARKRDVFAACYRFGGEGEAARATMEPEAMELDELVRRLRDRESPLLVGDGALRHRAELERKLGARVVPAHLGMPRASALLWLAFAAPELAAAADAAAWEPDYLRASGAERIAAARSAGA